MSDTTYAPRVGDKVRMVPKPSEGIVAKVTGDGQYLIDYAGPGGWSQRDHFHPAKYAFELLEAAPVLFVVGQAVTEEMGEPPVGSAVVQNGNMYVHREDEWAKVFPELWDGFRWAHFRGGVLARNITLIQLGASL